MGLLLIPTAFRGHILVACLMSGGGNILHCLSQISGSLCPKFFKNTSLESFFFKARKASGSLSCKALHLPFDTPVKLELELYFLLFK